MPARPTLPDAGHDPGEDRLVQPDVALASALALDRSSPVPLYHQLVEAVTRLVRAGTLRDGDRLPPERDLAEIAAVSRMTARQALAELDRAGVVTSRHGVGTFVTGQTVTQDAIHFLGFTELAERAGLAATTVVLGCEVVTGSPDATAALGLPDGAPLLLVTRVRSLGGVPTVHETSQLDAARFGDLIEADLSGSLYRLLEQRHGLWLTHAREAIGADLATADTGPALGLDPGAPVLTLTGTAFRDAEPVEWFRAVYRADRVRLAVESRRRPGDREARAPVSLELAESPPPLT